jgi:hypothetical protein
VRDAGFGFGVRRFSAAFWGFGFAAFFSTSKEKQKKAAEKRRTPKPKPASRTVKVGIRL